MAFSLLFSFPAAQAAPATVAVHPLNVTTHLTAYAKVKPISLARLRAPMAGILKGLTVTPGQDVQSGDVIGRLEGAQVRSQLARRRSAVDSARAELRAARRSLAIERKKGAEHLGTRQAVDEAQARRAKAAAQLAAAQAALRAVQHGKVLHAPADGSILSLAASNGDRVTAGQRVLTLQPAHHLWLMATYYGSDVAAIHAGLQGRFKPADGSPPIPVTVRSVLPTQRPDGGRPVALRARISDPGWVNGEGGALTLQGPSHTAVAVPTRALVLDRGQWWVLVHTAQGSQRRAVTLGPSRGENTLVEKGLKAGARVIVTNPYLRFHRDFSRRYQAPD